MRRHHFAELILHELIVHNDDHETCLIELDQTHCEHKHDKSFAVTCWEAQEAPLLVKRHNLRC